MTNTIKFLTRLRQGVLLADGAMGTMLHHMGSHMDACFDALNLHDPTQVQRIHQDFLEAGAELIETNTFGANVFKLREHGYEGSVAAINTTAVSLAQAAIADYRSKHPELASSPRYVGGSVGPLGVRIAPYGRVKAEQAEAAFRTQIAALIEAGVDVVILETFSDLNEMEIAIRAVHSISHNVPLIASMTFTRDDRTIYGDAPREVAHELVAWGIPVIGINCSGGPSQLARIGQIMRSVEPDILLSIMPNAGFPETIAGRVMYPATPEYFGHYAITFRDMGVNVIGGCCGTTPEHIREMRQALDTADRQSTITVTLPGTNGHDRAPSPELPTELAEKLAVGKFVFTVELSPPRSFTAQKVLASASMLREAGVDMINVSDSPMARMRMSPWAVCYLIQDRLQMDTTLHFPTRGRNLLRIQGDLLAAHALNVRNIFVVMGDPTNIGDYPEANDKYDIVPSGLIKLIKHSLNAGRDQAGNSIGQPTSFMVGCALNMGAPDLDAEIKTLRKKLEAGADFALTQTIYQTATVERFLNRYEQLYGTLQLPILAGVLPLYGARHAAFLHNEVPGIEIPTHLMARITKAGETAPEVGIEIAVELLLELRKVVQGTYLIPPFAKYEMAADIVEAVLKSAPV